MTNCETLENNEMEFGKLVQLFEQTQKKMQNQAAKSVDIALVVRNWLFGLYIVEFENGAAERAKLYGKSLIEQLAKRLKTQGIKGMSPTNLRKCREFYQTYSKIQQALPVKSFQILFNDSLLKTVSAELSGCFILGWTHYVTLLTLKNAKERRFYELEAAENGWGFE